MICYNGFLCIQILISEFVNIQGWNSSLKYCDLTVLFKSYCTCPSLALQKENSSPPFGTLWLIFHWVQLILKLDADKVRSIDCLIYSHRVCTPWAVKLQNSNQGNTETLKIFIENCPENTSGPVLPLSFITFVVVQRNVWNWVSLCFVQENHPACLYRHKSVILDLVEKCFTEKGFWSHDISPDSVLHQTPITQGLVVLRQ